MASARRGNIGGSIGAAGLLLACLALLLDGHGLASAKTTLSPATIYGSIAVGSSAVASFLQS